MLRTTARMIAMRRLGTRRVATFNDLLRHWQHLHRKGRLEPGRLHVQFVLPSGLTHPRLWTLSGLDEAPTPAHARDLAEAIEYVIGDEPDGTVAILTTLTERGLPDEHELAWCRAIHAAVARTPVRSWPLFHANVDTLGLVPPDALIANSPYSWD